MNEKSKAIIDKLNPAQKEAVLSTDGPVMVIAGAGAGKTRTIVARIFHLIQKGVAPENILAITFTNKAAGEMKTRVANILNGERQTNPFSDYGPTVSTFHSLATRIIRENAKTVGLTKNFKIFDKSDSKTAIKEALSDIGIDPKSVEPGAILATISREKGNLNTVDTYAENASKDFFSRTVTEVWRAYKTILKKENGLDFDDLLLEAHKLLDTNAQILAGYKQKWQYLHVDEYQDTNRVQYALARLLARPQNNIFVVGDVDQTIYTWRGAQIKNLLEFEKDYPNTKVVMLEENYRSSKNIITVANNVISKNRIRFEKKLFTGNPDGEKLSIYGAYDEADEASFIAKTAEKLIKSGSSPSEIAVLYRANFQSRAIEEAMLAEDIPYQVVGTRFFERREIKDAISYIRSALEPENVSNYKRIINVPPRGIGKLTLLKILAGKESELPQKTRERIADFRLLLSRIRTACLSKPPSKLIKDVVQETGLLNYLKTSDPDSVERLENIRELASLAIKYDGMPLGEGLEQFLTDASLSSDQDEIKDDSKAVRLMTVHSAKGLEFDYVFIAGLEDGLFPHIKMGESEMTEEANEEERRLFYVAITRARKKIFLSHASVRTIFGSRQAGMPSEFFEDIDDNLSEKELHPILGIKTIYLK